MRKKLCNDCEGKAWRAEMAGGGIAVATDVCELVPKCECDVCATDVIKRVEIDSSILKKRALLN